MAIINVSVQYSGQLLPDIIHYTVDPRLLPLGNPFKCRVEALSLQPMKQYIIIIMLNVVLHCLWFVFCFLSGVPAWRLM